MEVGGKIFTGAAATVILAIAGHLVTGESYISGLEEKAKTELAAQGMDGVEMQLSRNPLSRHAILDGEVSDDIKETALAAVASVAGISGANWAGDQNSPESTTDGSSQEASTVNSNCQEKVDTAIAGRKLSFRSGSAYISRESNEIIDSVASALQTCSDYAIAIGGHTDNNGNAEVNKTMSQERADRVRAGLIDRGIAENLVTATGYGSEQPLATDSGPEADATNRRIEFKILASGNDADAQQGK
ncbi:OmpA-OmpF porin, OOP family [Parasphingorhabdus marina DSM 22363]|uniref:OmpA-OmpF porin, OOP family n=1 Tax=Parasphingorhabdus marina DSM 22363 TaxID=1123272 RepID=A0A1N6H6J9_9SPHN|nr:OmpA family protein [Parasphingorhabdus marina]SIO15400.1 OmpA-OmpF porin, OOP family [Parasphingorhabdus marina DSM 22363]